MSLVLHIDGSRWRRHLSATVAAYPGVVPVVKGNGYGFGAARLLAECARLAGSAGVSTVAVGTYLEVPEALADVPTDVLVMEPYRPAIHGGLGYLADPAVIHTVTSSGDLHSLVGLTGSPRVVLEGLTSMNRHGMPPAGLRALLADPAGACVVGVTLHLPLGTGHLAEVQTWVGALPDVRSWFVSHVSVDELAELRRANPGIDLKPRVGTALWLGDPGALTVLAHVLDVRAVTSGDRAGYRQRRLSAGHLVVVSGGTAHGVALEAPSSVATPRARAIALAEGVMEAAGRVRSPFTFGGRPAWFVEPPHMQVSLVALPKDVAPPQIGDTVPVRMRLTTLHADAVVLD
jgi:hypothetical protein